MPIPAQLDHLPADELRQLVQGLAARVARQDEWLGEKDRELTWRQAKIDKLTHELAMYKRWRLGVRTEH